MNCSVASHGSFTAPSQRHPLGCKPFFAVRILPQIEEFMAGWNFAMAFVLGLVAKDKTDWRMPERLRNTSNH